MAYRRRLPFRKLATAPDTPGAGDVVFYVSTAGELIRVDSDGSEHTLGGAAGAHVHAEGDVTGLVTDLSGKSATGHTHDLSNYPTFD